MIVRKVSSQETYQIEGKLEDELIPQGTTFINVDYDASGKVKNVFYNNSNSARRDHKRMLKELDKMNSRRQTQEEMNKVVGLLRRLSL